jgi:hypothetical protein
MTRSLPDCRKMLTLKDAAAYIMKLPKAEQNLEEWQTAIGCLIGAAEGRDFMMHARIVRIAHSLPRIYGVLQKRKYLMIRKSQGALVGAFGKGPSICWTNLIFVSNTCSPS